MYNTRTTWNTEMGTLFTPRKKGSNEEIPRVINLDDLAGANPAVNTPRPSRGTRIESCDFIVLVGDP